MKILLDECVTKKLKPYLSEFEVYSVVEMGWSGVKNGELLKLCIENNFDILLTIDKNLVFQHNLDNYSITVAVLNSKNSKIKEILLVLPNLKKQIPNFKKHKAYIVNP
ncbi:MAG: hypothetical protein RO257_04860 [Candidatus Kapabacteria bacterium]|nr:hypothetical protein [Candidatus Kapabacteria bacterium]